MKGERKVLVAVVASLMLLAMLGVFCLPDRQVGAAGGECHCGGRVFNDSTDNPYTCGQCTWYASYMRQDIPDSEHWGDAGGWDDVARAHTDPEFSVGEFPYEGAIAVYEGWLLDIDDLGHVAHVDEVQGNSFKVSEMNWHGRCFNENRWDVKRDGVSFIYPPSSTPRQLLPYEGYWVEYGDPAELRWYGNWDSYELWIEVIHEGSGLPEDAEFFSYVWGIGGTSVDFYDFEDPDAFPGRHTGWPNGYPLVQGTYFWWVRGCDSGGNCTDWSDWQFFHLVDCYYSSQSMGASSRDTHYCPPGSVNPTPMPTSTPFPTPTSEPLPTGTPQPTATPTSIPSNCGDGTEPGVYLYSDKNFKGDCTRFTGDDPDLSDTAVGDDEASSIDLVGNYTAEMWEYKNYEGRSEEFSHDDENLDDHSLCSQWSSIKVHHWDVSGEGIILCRNPDYGGICERFIESDDDLSNNDIGGNEASSLKVRGPYMVWVFDWPHYKGPREDFFHNDSDLRDDFHSDGTWDDDISSLVVAPAVALYEHINYGGRCETFGLGEEVSNLRGSYIQQDSASSLKVPWGWKIAVCEHPDFQGVCEVFEHGDSDLRNNPIGNDTISSLRVEEIPPKTSDLITNIWVASSRGYTANLLREGNSYYIDRGYVIAPSIPAPFQDLVWIKTANDDAEDTREDFLYFTVLGDAQVYIAYDKRGVPPTWVRNFGDTGMRINVTDGGATPLRIYGPRNYSAGSRVTLGGNWASGSDQGAESMYVVIADVDSPMPTQTPTPPPTSSPTATPTPTPTPTPAFEYQIYLPLVVVDI